MDWFITYIERQIYNDVIKLADCLDLQVDYTS